MGKDTEAASTPHEQMLELLDDEESSGEEVQDTADATEEPDEEPSEDADDEDEDDAEDEASEDEEASEDDEEPEEQAEQPTAFTVTIDGKEQQVTLDELRNGYQRQADYTRKTMAVAEERRAIAAEKEQALREKDTYGKLVTEYRKVLDSILRNEPDWGKLREEDPQRYLLARDEWKNAQAEREAAAAEEARLAKDAQESSQKAYQQRLQEEQGKLLEALPAWKTPAVAQREARVIQRFMNARGFSDDELRPAFADHRVVLLARDAALYDQLQRRSTTRLSTPAPAKTKALKPGSRTTPRKVSSALKQRFAQTGKARDAARVFEAMDLF